MLGHDENGRGFRGPVTCENCGCRLEASTGAHDGEYRHFDGRAGRDARGCRVDCAELVHDMSGKPLGVPSAV